MKGKTLEQAIKLANQGWLCGRQTSFAQAMFSEFTDRYYSLSALGLATVEEGPEYGDLFKDFPAVGLDCERRRRCSEPGSGCILSATRSGPKEPRFASSVRAGPHRTGSTQQDVARAARPI